MKASNKMDFPGIKVKETTFLKTGMGVSLPPFGIFTYKNASTALKQHEYGHYLQYRDLGFFKFYWSIGLPSLWSATFFPKLHHQQPFEIDANRRAEVFFDEFYCPF